MTHEKTLDRQVKRIEELEQYVERIAETTVADDRFSMRRSLDAMKHDATTLTKHEQENKS